MKKAAIVVLAALVLITFSGCRFKVNAENIVEKYDSLTEWLGHFQITRDYQLIGERKYGSDHYIGSSTSDCQSVSGRDVIFGGASIKQRKIKLSASIIAENGSATVRIRLGADVEEQKFTSNGYLEKELILNGGSYIMLDYDNFSGSVLLTSDYITE